MKLIIDKFTKSIDSNTKFVILFVIFLLLVFFNFYSCFTGHW